ncbi:MAG: META domain-containing protein [Ignavibacteria bacterium]|nr:META domain-containing protein [Ignavibacteria bacterium]
MYKAKVFFWFCIAVLASASTGYAISGTTCIADDSLKQMRRAYDAGVMFAGGGEGYSWGVAIFRDKAIKFRATGDRSLNTPSSQLEQNLNSQTMTYTADVESGSISVTIIPEECTNKVAGETNYSVEVKVRKGVEEQFTFLNGCGRFVPDYGLEGKWSLYKIGNSVIDKDAYPVSIPFLEFIPDSALVKGIAGCNRIQSKYIQEGNRFSVAELMSTEMGCPEEMRENEIISGLRSADTYSLVKGELEFSNASGVKLVYLREGVQPDNDSTVLTGRYNILNDIWALEKIKGRELSRADFPKGPPILEMHIRDATYFISSECSGYRGSFACTDETLAFGKAEETERKCNPETEVEMLNALYSARQWTAENLRLYITDGKKILLVFRKID